MSVCYDLRFPELYSALRAAGAELISAPAAFTAVTGAAHWDVLVRARAIETGSWVLAPAQTGQHDLSRGRPRSTHGHSLVVDPWGEVTARQGIEPGLLWADVDLDRVTDVRGRIPSLAHDRMYHPPG